MVPAIKQFDTSGKSPAYCHRCKNAARAGKLAAGFSLSVSSFSLSVSSMNRNGGANRDAASSMHRRQTSRRRVAVRVLFAGTRERAGRRRGQSPRPSAVLATRIRFAPEMIAAAIMPRI
jgi:hypothetical protein